MVPKKDGLVITPDKYSLPNMHDLSNGCMVAAFFFQKWILSKGYHQIPVAASDIPKTAVITPFGFFQYLFMPFGLSNAAQTFQRMMDSTKEGLEGEFAYMDDSSVGSPDRQTHLCHLEVFFNAVATNCLTINLEKWVFQCLLWKFLATRFQQQGWPPKPLTPQKLNFAHPIRISNSCNVSSAW
jgi:hypothetical protein